MKALILYFSGTGNTKYVAKLIDSEMRTLGLSTELHSIEEAFSIQPDTYDFLVLGCPKYYERPVFYFIDYLKKNLPKSKNTVPAMMFCTQAGPLNTDFKGLEKMLAKKNHRIIAEESITLANNLLFFGTFKPTDPEKINEATENARQLVKPLVAAFVSGKGNKQSLNPFLVASEQLVAVLCTKFMPVFAMKYSASSDCIGCGLCAKKCPKQNIAMREHRPVFGKQCIFCTRCINICPANAILYHNKKCPQYKLIEKI